jgi:hypothetical protein
MAIGLVIYFAYGRHNSVLARAELAGGGPRGPGGGPTGSGLNPTVSHPAASRKPKP